MVMVRLGSGSGLGFGLGSGLGLSLGSGLRLDLLLAAVWVLDATPRGGVGHRRAHLLLRDVRVDGVAVRVGVVGVDERHRAYHHLVRLEQRVQRRRWLGLRLGLGLGLGLGIGLWLGLGVGLG